ncbi:MAG: ATP-binding cassette domain-containing protein [Saprospiraceae bacterium]|uniref:ATP-binding cassette domain-containing protein n=1 Tax=Candidatus Opimibacter skivensis TaxID=2982028 RepID=A0A9D7XV39_9BACT|nr:ATP-binding cassette domain-containing protein [Candidatus Opimibacter skivensis]
MDLYIQKLSKAFNQKPIFNNLSFEIRAGSRFAITGSNGSGKSTLLKILSGGMLPTSGVITYYLEGKKIPEESLFRQVHFVAPYNSVIEELSLKELFHLHKSLGLLKGYPIFQDWFSNLHYPFSPDQQIKSFSSGMKQRVKLGLTLLDDRPLVLLDEPTSNLDEQGKTWFFNLLGQLREFQTLVIASNDALEISYCTARINLDGVVSVVD